jgi:hypothetical protein
MSVALLAMIVTVRQGQALAPTIKPTGAFIQWYLPQNWKESDWDSEFAAMKSVGNEVLVFSSAADSGTHEAYYPCRVPGLFPAKGYPDVLELCLKSATKAGVQVFVGTNRTEEWWRKEGNDENWLLGQMDIGNAVADDLYKRYKARYPKAFHGWYWDWEVDNFNFKPKAKQVVLSGALERTLAHLSKLDPSMPMMMCPFVNARFGTPSDVEAMWRNIFSGCHLRKGDIFCPQDSVGAGGDDLTNFTGYFEAYKRAVETVPGLQLWDDMETFDEFDVAAPLDRVRKQLLGVQPYVQGIVTFSYCHFYSPMDHNPVWQEAYRALIEGRPFQKRGVSAPSELGLRRSGQAVELSWKGSDLYGYEIRRDGKVIGRLGPNDSRTATDGSRTFEDKHPTDAARYSLTAWDVYGNRSETRGFAP